MTQPSVMQVTGDDSGALYTIKLNEILSANTTLFAGTSAPANPVAHMIWQDTSVDPPREYRRNATNSGWVDLGRRGAATFYGNVSGSSATTDKLTTPRAISISGAGTGSTTFDGSANANIALTLANSGVAAGTYGSASKIPVLTVNAKGLITGVTLADNPTATGYVSSWNGRQGAVSLTSGDLAAFKVFEDYNTRSDTWGTGPIFSQDWGYIESPRTLISKNLLSEYGRGTYFIQVRWQCRESNLRRSRYFYWEVNDSLPHGVIDDGVGTSFQDWNVRMVYRDSGSSHLTTSDSFSGEILYYTGFTLRVIEETASADLQYLNLRIWKRTY